MKCRNEGHKGVLWHLTIIQPMALTNNKCKRFLQRDKSPMSPLMRCRGLATWRVLCFEIDGRSGSSISDPSRRGLNMKKILLAASLVGAFSLASQNASATAVSVNFDSVTTSGGFASGAPVSTYLSGYGITFSTSYANITPYVLDYSVEPWVAVISTPNFFTTGGSATYYTYDFAFSTPLDSFGFTVPGVACGSTMAAWSATALSASSTVLNSAGNGGISDCTSSVSYLLNGPAITDVRFSSNAFDFAGMNLNVDNLVLNTVPEPITLSLFGVGLVGAVAIRRRRKASA